MATWWYSSVSTLSAANAFVDRTCLEELAYLMATSFTTISLGPHQFNEDLNIGLFIRIVLLPFPKTRNSGLPTRLITGLYYLNTRLHLSDEEVVARWVEIPYWQPCSQL